MKEALIWVRNKISRFVYRRVAKPIFFRQDPEHVHDKMTRMGRFIGKNWLLRRLTGIAFDYHNGVLRQTVVGIAFENPVGLAGGFDKDAQLTEVLPTVGFGFVEVGSITGDACEGNPKPRLWRLPNSKSLGVYYGLKNRGCEAIAAELQDKYFAVPVGINIAKTNCAETVETEAGIADYVKGFKAFKTIGSYFTINISCPNVYGGQPFTDADKLDKLLTAIDDIPTTKPIFLKISPDLSESELDSLVAVVKKHRIHGFIATNLTKKRDSDKIKGDEVPENGGLSGKVVHEQSVQMVRDLYRKTNGQYAIIGLGGIFNADDAYKMIRSGASLVQLITGMIFNGPQVISEINQGLVRRLKRDGFSNISEAIGVDNKGL